MSNGRLYLVDTERVEAVLLAKGWSDGWSPWASPDPDRDWRTWLADRDIKGALGGETCLRLMGETEWFAMLAAKT